jgi:hypothetical protein
MSDDEILVLFTSIFIAAWGWYKWYTALGFFNSLNRKRPGLFRLSILPLMACGGIYYVLKTMASYDVREDTGYLWFYIIFGAAWIVAGRGIFFYLFDISWRDDAVERRNPVAVSAISGGIIGLAAFYAGANIGDGPGWWCVLFAGGLAAVVWFGFWYSGFHPGPTPRNPLIHHPLQRISGAFFTLFLLSPLFYWSRPCPKTPTMGWLSLF